MPWFALGPFPNSFRMAILEPTLVAIASGVTPRWKKVLFYAGLVVLIVALNYLAARNEKPPQGQPANKTSAPAEHEMQKSGRSRTLERTKTAEEIDAGNAVDSSDDRASDNAVPPANAQSKPTSVPSQSASDEDLVLRNMRIRNEDGRVVYSGDVDLRPTLDRIERGKRLRFPNDGVVFENRERRLPTKPSGYYHEYVLPTRGDDGPGPQRIVTGGASEVYYTPDHYKSFRRIK